jgi:hypothetical protein
MGIGLGSDAIESLIEGLDGPAGGCLLNTGSEGFVE